jgi:hypothetical protein
LLSYAGGNGPREVGGGDVVRSTVGDGEGGLWRSSDFMDGSSGIVTTDGPPPSSISAREALVWRFDGMSLGGNGG